MPRLTNTYSVIQFCRAQNKNKENWQNMSKLDDSFRSTYKVNVLMARTGTFVLMSSSSIPTLFLSKYFSNAPAALT